VVRAQHDEIFGALGYSPEAIAAFSGEGS